MGRDNGNGAAPLELASGENGALTPADRADAIARVSQASPNKRQWMDRLIFAAVDCDETQIAIVVGMLETLTRNPADPQNGPRWAVLATFVDGLASTRR